MAVGDRCMSHGASARACVVESGACAILRRTGERLKSGETETETRSRPRRAPPVARSPRVVHFTLGCRSVGSSPLHQSLHYTILYSTLSLSAGLTSCVSGRPSAAYAFSQRGQHHYRLDKFSLLFHLSTRFFCSQIIRNIS